MLIAGDDNLVVLCARQGWRDIKFACRVPVLAVSDESIVHPDVESRRKTTEAQMCASSLAERLLEGIVQSERAPVECNSALLRRVGGLRVLVTVPRHLNVDVRRRPKALSFEC